MDQLNAYTFNRNYNGQVVVLDIEANLNGDIGRGKKCDLVLLNTLTDELMFVEGKVFSDSRVNVTPPNSPEVIEQVNTYTAAISEQNQNILKQYARHIEIINDLFGTSFNAPKKLIEPAKLLVYDTPKSPTKNGDYSIEKINSELGVNNVLWVKSNENPMLDEIWNVLTKQSDIVFFDLETTGLSCEEDFIIAIGAVKLRHGQIVDGFHSFVACSQPLSEEVETLTGIKNQDVANAPTIEEVLENFYGFSKGCVLAAYNLSFDWGFMISNAEKCGLSFDNEKIDILPLAKEKLQGQVKNFKLNTIADYFGIDTQTKSVLNVTKLAAGVFINLTN